MFHDALSRPDDAVRSGGRVVDDAGGVDGGVGSVKHADHAVLGVPFIVAVRPGENGRE